MHIKENIFCLENFTFNLKKVVGYVRTEAKDDKYRVTLYFEGNKTPEEYILSYDDEYKLSNAWYWANISASEGNYDKKLEMLEEIRDRMGYR